jgi:hypothetical protein
MKLVHQVEPLLQNPFAFYSSHIRLAHEDRINIVQNELVLYYKGMIEWMQQQIDTALVGQDYMINEVSELQK